MAFYQYQCDQCGRTFEVRQSIKDPKFTNHYDVTEGHEGLEEPCHGTIHRLIGNPQIIFKGTGWTVSKKDQFDKMNGRLDDMGIEEA